MSALPADREALDSLISYLSIIGRVIYFADDHALSGVVILEPLLLANIFSSFLGGILSV